jgi:hypothetical protein
MPGGMNALCTGEIAIFVEKVQSLYIHQINPIKFIAMIVGGETAGILLPMVGILISVVHFSNNFQNFSEKCHVWLF